MNKKQLVVALFLFANCLSFYYSSPAQAEWVTEEKTNIVGKISGIIKIGSIFKTASGNIYEVTASTVEVVTGISPQVLVLRDGDNYKLVVDGFREPLICKKISGPVWGAGGESEVETHMAGAFNGWDGDTIFKLDNGQIWQQSSYGYAYQYAFRPGVSIRKAKGGYVMKVEGVDKTISVKRLK